MSLVDDLQNVGAGFIGKKPLYSNGVRIGYWSVGGDYFDLSPSAVMSNVCNQIVDLDPGLSPDQLDARSWTTTDDFGFSTTVQDYCLKKGVVPNWATQADLNDYSLTGGGGMVRTPNALIVPLAIAGGLIAVSLLFLGRR